MILTGKFRSTTLLILLKKRGNLINIRYSINQNMLQKDDFVITVEDVPNIIALKSENIKRLLHENPTNSSKIFPISLMRLDYFIIETGYNTYRFFDFNLNPIPLDYLPEQHLQGEKKLIYEVTDLYTRRFDDYGILLVGKIEKIEKIDLKFKLIRCVNILNLRKPGNVEFEEWTSDFKTVNKYFTEHNIPEI